ncbi:MAG: transposase [Pygmaiobacter massiliensis]|nr:transposase [Pygmaiobacter massiliensis]
MYQETMAQLTVYDIVSPLRETLSPDNRWVRLAEQIDWRALEETYAAHFAQGGKQAIGVRCAFGSLVIKKALGLSDRQTVLIIEESPYLQYFIGMQSFGQPLPFAARTMVSFRERIPESEVAAAAKLLDKVPTGKKRRKG